MVSLENKTITIPFAKSQLNNPLSTIPCQVDATQMDQNANPNYISHSESNTESAYKEEVTKCLNEKKSEEQLVKSVQENLNGDNQNIEENIQKKNSINEADSKIQTKKVDFFKKNKDKLKELKEKKEKEAQELEKTRQKMQSNRDKLKELVLKRAAQIRSIKDEKESKENKDELVKPIIDTTNQKKLMEKAKMRKYFRSRYATLLNSISENNKIKQEKEVKKIILKENLKEKLKEELGISSVKSRVFSLEPKKITENNLENITNSDNKATKKAQKDNMPPIRTKSQVKPLPPDLQNKALKYIAQLSEKKLAKQIKDKKDKKHKEIVF